VLAFACVVESRTRASHAAHSPEPEAFLYVPTAHAAHGPPSGPVYPALHAQSVAAVLPAGASACAGQAWHSALPAVSWYLPAGQIVHGGAGLESWSWLSARSWDTTGAE
jgi:hypothetical protein